ncbi:UDP-N-acetylmuramate--L-alanine ligase [candidate division WOR-3 bacterium]|uniref:UDP-N-acetylmuramate--L-alanine ligase n=1 Tax=candidate division WOR-3 bacterium TaxID=2052148 RepID=A0A660SJX6_UNCW3|nr:MAG: UDP-N-acetylmuramate--L-alanine ligase [candidate division WOR-3 bacterium]
MLGKVKRIHFIGIGGIGMSGIALVLKNLGFQITGSDLKGGDAVRMLKRNGIKVFRGHRPENIGKADVVVYSSAITPENVELIAARSKKIPTIPRAEMLAELMRMKIGIAISGTHGKTTTTSMVGAVLEAGGMDPTMVIGGRLIATGENYRLGESRYLVVEADESDASFLHLTPVFIIITNIEREHLDFYHDLDEIKTAFLKFIEKVPFWGGVIINSDHPNNQTLIPIIKKRIITYGLYNSAEVKGEKIEWANWSSRFVIYYKNKRLGRVTIPLPGNHNVQNCLAAVAIGLELGISFKKIKQGLESFPGVHRRMEKVGEKGGVLYFDDYGHHPTEIAAVLATLRERFPKHRIIACFQPHRYTRIYHLIDDFARSFYSADLVLVTDIYPAGEKPIPGITGPIVAQRLKAVHPDVLYVGDLRGLNRRLKQIVTPGDIVITLGAGDITRVGRRLCLR